MSMSVKRSVAIIGTRGYPSYYGGFETLVRKLVPYLAERGWDVTIYGRTDAAARPNIIDEANVRTISTRGIESKSLSTLTFGATSVLDTAKQRPDVALVMNVANGYWLPLLRRRRVPSVVNVDGIEWQRAKWNWLGKSVFRVGAEFTARFGDTLIVDSSQIGRFWKTAFARDSVFIPYGGDIPDGDLPLEPNLEPRRYVLYVARFVPENTLAEFLGAAERLADRYPVVIVGSSGTGGGVLEDRVATLAEKHSAVSWLGHLSDDKRLHSLWQHCGAYFHGHSVGGTNPALVSAMACGAPTVARDTVYNRETLAKAGIFVAPEAGAIAGAIDSLMADPESQTSLGAAAQRRAREAYSWGGVCRAYERVLLEAVNDARPSRTIG